MVPALGYSHDLFSPADPGRLCRGRERWVESPEIDPDLTLNRVVVSGAAFSDDSARDALRGLSHSTISVGEVLEALLPGRTLVAWAEEGQPSRVPQGAQGVESYQLRSHGGPLSRWAARWQRACPTAADLDLALERGADVFVPAVPGKVATPVPSFGPPPAADERVEGHGGPSLLSQELVDRLYLLTGFRSAGPPARRFQPSGLDAVLEVADFLVLAHLDKHAPCLAIYSRTPVVELEALEELAHKRGVLAVPFAIPPMLARWDRALWELRQGWDEPAQGEFPVPAAREDRSRWSRRGHNFEE